MIEENKINNKVKKQLDHLKLKIDEVTILNKNRIIPCVIEKDLIPLILIVKDNASIRRYVSIELLKSFFKENKEKIGYDNNTNKYKSYITFQWDRYTLVDSNGFKQEFPYKTEFYMNALQNAIIELAESINNNINNYCNITQNDN